MKRMSKMVSMLMVVALMVGVLAAYSTAGAPAGNGIEKMTVKQYPDPKAAVTVDPKNPLACQLEGLYEMTLKVGSESRIVAQYFPKNLGYRQPEIALAVPAGKSYQTFFQASGWKAVADTFGIAVLLMIPDQGWKADETAYMEAAYSFMDARTYYQAQDSAFYLVGYEGGAKAAMAQAVLNADRYAGVACFGVDDMDLSILKQAATTESNKKGVMQSEVEVPVWIGASKLTDNVSALVEHWKEANECGDEPTSGKYADEIYEFPRHLATTNELTYANVSKVVLSIGNAFEDREFTTYLYSNFLRRVRRQDSGDINSLRAFATNQELGMDFVKMEVAGTTREFYVYVPSEVKSGKRSGVPVVFGFHGGGGAGEEFANRSALYKLAEERSFIAVFPTGSRGSKTALKASTTWARTDLDFFKKMREYILANYSADAKRVYSTGQSMGGVMTTHIVLECPELIAAGASTSAVVDLDKTYGTDHNGMVEDVMIPMMYSVGQKDAYFFEGGMSYPVAKTTKAYWCDRYGLDLANPGTYVDGNFNVSAYLNDAGVNLFRYQVVTDKIHAVIPDELYVIYDFFSQFSRGSDKTLYYLGEAIG